MVDAIQIDSVNHIGRETQDVEKSLAFYRDVLGFRQVRRPSFPFGGAWLFNYGVMVHLIEGTPAERTGEISTRTDHVAFHVGDIDAAESRLKQHGIEYVRNVSSASGVTQLFFHDPDGNHIELGNYPAVVEL